MSYVPPPLSLQNRPRVDPRPTRESRPEREAWNVPITCAGEDAPVAGLTETWAITVTPEIRSTHATWATPFARTSATSEAVALNARRPRPSRTTFPTIVRVTSRTWLGPETSRWTYPTRRCPLSAATEAESPGPIAAAGPHVTLSSALARTKTCATLGPVVPDHATATVRFCGWVAKERSEMDKNPVERARSPENVNPSSRDALW